MKSQQKTLFVIGAGASKEVNLPVGTELKKQISSSLDIRFDEWGSRRVSGDQIICDAFRVAARSDPRQDINPYLHSCWHIRDAMPQAISIDNFIDTHSDDERIELCGKLGIVRSILDAESNSHLCDKNSKGEKKLDFNRLGDTWYNSFWQLLTENCKATELDERFRKIALVIFNYDRCIEHYLHQALQNYYKTTATEASEILKNVEIYHPYGTVGSLPWQGLGNAIEFGGTPNPAQLLELAKQIKTFTEGTDESSSEILKVRSNIRLCGRLVFLGFAFHRLNMELLLPTNIAAVHGPHRTIFATAHGISKSDANAISEELNSKTGIPPNRTHVRNELSCSQLFREYWRSMTFAG
jgi:hypothetical protein